MKLGQLSLTKSARLQKISDRLAAQWQALGARDRLALGVLAAFLLLFAFGFGGYSIHSRADEKKQDYQQAVADYFWLRAQADNIDTSASDGSDEPPAAQINTLLLQAGIDSAQVVANNDAVQISFSGDSQALVGRAIAQIEQRGWRIDTLMIDQNLADKTLSVDAIVIP